MLTKMFNYVELYQIKCFISNCWQKSLIKCPGAKLFWRRIVRFYNVGAKLNGGEIVR